LSTKWSQSRGEEKGSFLFEISLTKPGLTASELVGIGSASWSDMLFDNAGYGLSTNIGKSLYHYLAVALHHAEYGDLVLSSSAPFSLALAAEIGLIHLYFAAERSSVGLMAIIYHSLSYGMKKPQPA